MQASDVPTAHRPSSTFLMTSSSMTGHLTSVLDLAQGLVSRGHRVLVFTAASARSLVETSGAELVPYQRYREMKERLAEAEKAAPGWTRLSPLLHYLYMLWSFRCALLDNARELVEELEPLLRREKVDCLVYDFAAFGAGHAAERVGLPAASVSNIGGAIDAQGVPLLLRTLPLARWVCHVPGLAHFLTDVLLPLRRVRSSLGLPPRQDRHAEIFQTNASRQLNLIRAPHCLLEGLCLRDNQVFAGPTAFDGGSPRQADLPPLEPGTILVSTTTVGGDGGLLHRVLEGVAPMRVPVLATTAGARKVPEGLGPHIRLERFVPHEQVIPRVAAVVTHGGVGMIGRALLHGVPMLIIPLFSDQPLNARLAAARGLAYHLPRTRSTPEAIREHLESLLKDQELRTRLKQVAEELRQLRARSPALEALEQLALGAREAEESRAAA